MLAPPNRAHLPPSPSLWTPEREVILRRAWDDGLSCRQIATELDCGFTRNAVIGKATRLRLPARKKVQARTKIRADKDRSATMRIKKLRVRGPSHGGTVVVESVVREEAPQPKDFLGIPLSDLRPLSVERENQCRYPRGDGASIRFCAQSTLPGQSWCKNCRAIVYQPAARPVLRPYLPTGGSKPRVF